MSNYKKIISLRVDQNLHQQLKMHVIMHNTTLQDYILGLVKKDMEQNKDNK